VNDSWQSGNPYDSFMGRWSKLVAKEFLDWLAAPAESRWLDVGCGTGSLTKQILAEQRPKNIIAVDSSSEFIAFAGRMIEDPTVQFKVGLAESLELESNSVEVTVSGLVLNFVSQPFEALSEMRRVTRPGGRIGIFLWDYAEGMEMLRYFWDAAVELDGSAQDFDEGHRFPLCQEGQLESLVRDAGLKHIEATAIEVNTVFQDFDDYWHPFLGHVGPAPTYTMGLQEEERQKLANRLRRSLPTAADGTIALKARAWAVKGEA
jgi:SAM-dependent methyltransferase